MTPKISVIVPVYKVEKYLPKCIDSILAQTFTDFELLLIDDGSPDNSGAICDEYAKKDSRIRVFHKENGGVSSARNLGLDEAKGEWIAFVDSDDWVGEQYLMSFYSAIINNDSTSVMFMMGHTKIYTDKESKDITFSFPDKLYNISEFRNLFEGDEIVNYGYPWAKLYNLSKVNSNNLRFNERIHFKEDLIFMLQYLLNVNQVVKLKDVGYNYIISGKESAIFRRFSFTSEKQCYDELKMLYLSIIDKFSLPIDKFNNNLMNQFNRVFAVYYSEQNNFRNRIEFLKSFVVPNSKIFLSDLPQYTIAQRIIVFLIKYQHLFLLDSFMRAIEIKSRAN